jgi:poly-gamma-glutamate capsule biosynthesis protein CapA/YwtB (metallophosphatase superfamily)
MTGRGIDQILHRPTSPEIHEPYVCDARDYVELAEQANGRVPCPVDPAYIWGDALDELDRVAPSARIINLETSITRSDDYWKGKGINYRMHPDNIACLTVAGIDTCTLANNHVLDYGYEGLVETLDTLKRGGLQSAGAGPTLAEARRPAMLEFADASHRSAAADGRLFVWSVGSESSGVPPAWAATPQRAGVDLLTDFSNAEADALADRYLQVKRPGDVGIVSIHWGSNWGYDIPEAHVQFAHRLIDNGIDLVHGHSSHHPRPIEVYRDKLVLYGCGDFLNDYEGIHGHERYRGDLALMYFPTVDPATGKLRALAMTPMQVRRMKLHYASQCDAEWLHVTLNRISEPFGCHVDMLVNRTLALQFCPVGSR